MVKAFLGISIESGGVQGDWTRITSTRDEISQIKGVTEIYGIFGRFDLMAIIEVQNLEDIHTLVWEKIRAISGVQATETFIVSF
jgi:DNA-binding Lrp family transcriptional regulator